MGVKVIKARVSPNNKPRRFDCRDCKSTLEFVPATQKVHLDQRDGDYYKIKCPECGNENYINV